jgi:hypothetical protein
MQCWCKSEKLENLIINFSGLPSIALDLYRSAIDQLKSAEDLLWLGAAYEGWATAALIVQKQQLIEKPEEHYKKIISKLKSALENYERFSFVAFVEFECVLKVALVYRQQRMFVQTEVSTFSHNLYRIFSLFYAIIFANIWTTILRTLIIL